MAKIIEIMGSTAIGKTTIYKHLTTIYKPNEICDYYIPNSPPCFLDSFTSKVEKYDIKHWGRLKKSGIKYEDILHYNRSKYVIVDKRIYHYLFSILFYSNKKNNLIRKSDNFMREKYVIENYDENILKEILNDFPQIHAVFNLKCDINEILRRENERKRDQEVNLEILETTINYIDLICNFLKNNNVLVYEIDTSIEKEINADKIKKILMEAI